MKRTRLSILMGQGTKSTTESDIRRHMVEDGHGVGRCFAKCCLPSAVRGPVLFTRQPVCLDLLERCHGCTAKTVTFTPATIFSRARPLPFMARRGRLCGRTRRRCRRLVQGLSRLALLPKRLSHGERGDAARLPPRHLFSGAMQLAMVRATQRHGVFVADLSAQSARLGKRQDDGGPTAAWRRPSRVACARTEGAPCCGGGRSS